jgi:transcriptional regulator with XRE-family HTH domain
MAKIGTTAEQTGAAVAANIARLRKAQGFSLKELAQELDRVGHRLGLSALSRIENQSRGVDVDDLMAIAVVLNVSPLGLLLPVALRPSDMIQTTGLPSADRAMDVWRWAVGSAPIATSEQMEDAVSDIATYHTQSLPPWLSVKIGPGWDTAYGALRIDS